MAHTEQPDQTPGKILDHDAGIGEADKELVEQRAKELAAIDGLSTHDVTDTHRFQARQELAGRADPFAANDDEGVIAGLIEPDDVPGESGWRYFACQQCGCVGRRTIHWRGALC